MSHLARNARGPNPVRRAWRVFYDPGQGEFGILWSLRKTAGEIVEAAGEPG